MHRGGFTYIVTNGHHRILYTGVTSDLKDRVWKHRMKYFPTGFTARYNGDKLVWYEQFDTIEAAIRREKQIKGGSRAKKIALIEAMNPEWKDLWEEVQHW